MARSNADNGDDEFQWMDAIAYSGLGALRLVFGGMAGGVMAIVFLSDISSGWTAFYFAVLVIATWFVELTLRRTAGMELF